MPNWCWGYIELKGKPKDVENFCKLFVFEDEVDKDDSKKGQKYFARSFVHQNWKDFKKEYFGDITTEKEWDISFNVDFAWSCWSCLFEGYPDDWKECVTLKWAIKKYNVNVKIETEEGGMGFEEKIITRNKKPTYDSFDMPKHICQKCGNEQMIASSYDLEDVECYECGEYGKWKDELTEIVKKKLEKISSEKFKKIRGKK